MNKVEFVQGDQGSSRPIFLERRVDNPNLLTPLVDQLIDLGIITDPLKKGMFHLTWYYLGKPERLQSQLAHANPRLDTENFINALEDLLVDIDDMEWVEVNAYSEKLAFYSYPPRSFLALKLQKTAELLEGRSKVTARIIRFLQACGITNSEDFMRSNRNLKFQPDDRFNPHVTLGIRHPDVELPEIDVSEIELGLKAPRLFNVKIV